MSPTDPYNLALLLQTLADRGVQVWQNRGRLYYAPRAKVDAADRALLTAAKDDLIAVLNRYHMQPLYPFGLVAPCPADAGSYAGALPRKPWDYEVAVLLPTFGRLDLVEAAVACWRNQTVSPYLIVVDTGGADQADEDGGGGGQADEDGGGLVDDLELLRSADCEIHYIAAHGWRHSSQPVAAALDLAFAVCQTPVALLTHVDVFPRRSTVLEELLPRLSPSCPVVGYQMSRRIGSEEWASCVSHTLTLCDMRVMRRARATWNLLAALEADGEVEERYLGWPDTETWFGRGLRAAGIVPEFLGAESNASCYATDLIVHWRSAPSIRHYYPDQAEQRHPGLARWLAATRRQGVAAELPPHAVQL